MRRVLVPLDGTELSEAIIPDARRLAGAQGTLILVRELTHGSEEPAVDAPNNEAWESHLEQQAAGLRSQGIQAEAHFMVQSDPALAIDHAIGSYGASAVAIATHGRRPFQRLLKGSVAWKALSHSSVPVLLRHVERPHAIVTEPEGGRAILVPLDGSAYAEKAIPLARQLAAEWNAALHLMRVTPNLQPDAGGPAQSYPVPDRVFEQERQEAETYLHEIAARMPGDVACHTVIGAVTENIVAGVEKFGITDVVVASHGRTGLRRVLLGSVVDDLVHELRIPVIVVPALAVVAST